MKNLPHLYVEKKLKDNFVERALIGEFLDRESADKIIDTTIGLYDIHTQEPIGILLKGVIPENLNQDGYNALKIFAKPDNNRGIASGKIRRDLIRKDHQKLDIEVSPDGFRYRPILPDGTRSRNTYSNMSNGGIFGFFEATPRFPYCRQTSITLDNPDNYKEAIPYIQHIDSLFKDTVPDRYANQLEEVLKTNSSYVIYDTVFTTLTVNKNFATAVHMDKGDLDKGFSCLTVPRSRGYRGGYTVLTSYRIGFNVQEGDLLLMNAHNWHHNTPINPVDEDYERLVCVFYYRTNMITCSSEEEELKKAQERADKKLYKDRGL